MVGAVTEVEWDPERYLAQMLDEIPGYVELEERVAAATAGLEIRDALELGVGTAETATRILAQHPRARWTGIDASEPMLARARERLPDADLRRARLEDPLPAGPFDLVVSALVVHHLDGPGKRDLFRRVAAVLRPGGVLVLGDVVVPERPEDVRIDIDWVVDLPDRLDDQLEWLREAGLEPEPLWTEADLAVIRASKPPK
jgi:tRNA (cmo5U34)-methyltransferase